MYNRHRDEIESGDFKNSRKAHIREPNPSDPTNRKKDIHKRIKNEHAGEPL